VNAPVQSIADRDYFTDRTVLLDPYAWFEAKRAEGPVTRLPDRNALLVTGFQECVSVLLDTENFSSFVATVPTEPLPFPVESDDITAQLEAQRGRNPMTDLMVNYDGPRHTAARSLLTSLFTPSRLRANEEYMTGLAEKMIAEVVARGKAEMIHEIASPYVTLVIADLLGVPDDDREKFRAVIDQGAPAGNIEAANDTREVGGPLIFMAGFFMQYVSERRANPRDDVLSELSNARYPDGTEPDQMEVVKAAMFLFAAGQDTSAKLLGNSVRHLCDNPDLQSQLRADPSLIPGFIEEMLRVEGSTKATFRVAKRNTRIGDVDVPVGTTVIVGLAAANRDPRRWEEPTDFRIGRPKIKEHLAFGRGSHVCIGAPLARVEVRVLLEQLLAQTSDLRISAEHHGPDGRDLQYEPTYIIRGLERLNVELDPR
jgi:cytochrome P450